MSGQMHLSVNPQSRNGSSQGEERDHRSGVVLLEPCRRRADTHGLVIVGVDQVLNQLETLSKQAG